MSITVRSGKRGTSIKATGSDAMALFLALTGELDKQAPVSAAKPVPNRPKNKTGVLGAAGAQKASTALKSEQG